MHLQVSIITHNTVDQENIFRSVSGSSNRHPIPGHRAPSVAMIGWHVARPWAPSAVGVINQNGVDVQAISNLAIGFPFLN